MHTELYGFPSIPLSGEFNRIGINECTMYMFRLRPDDLPKVRKRMAAEPTKEPWSAALASDAFPSKQCHLPRSHWWEDAR